MFRRGDILPAEAMNELVRAVSRQIIGLGGVQGPGGVWISGRPQRTEYVYVRNMSGADRAKFDVLGLDRPDILPSDDLKGFQRRIVMHGVLPAEEHAGGRCAILLGAAKAGSVTRAAIAGLTIARVDMIVAQHQWAEPAPGETSALRSAETGSNRILWTAGDTGEQWAIVRLGGGGGSFADQVIVVRVENDGGSAGDLNGSCTFTYRIWDNYADYQVDPPLAEGLSPAQIRLPNTKYVAANANSRGLAFYDTDAGVWRLLYCFRERPDVGDCSV